MWRARTGRWFPELVDPAVRALTWPQIAPITSGTDTLDASVTVATIAQRLGDDMVWTCKSRRYAFTSQLLSLDSILESGSRCLVVRSMRAARPRSTQSSGHVVRPGFGSARGCSR